MEQTLACKICGRNANGFHYGVIACEACKAFFKRISEKKSRPACFFGGNCSTLATDRSRCKACRFRKCATYGMKIRELDLTGKPNHQKKDIPAGCGFDPWDSPNAVDQNKADKGISRSPPVRHLLQNFIITTGGPAEVVRFPCGMRVSDTMPTDHLQDSPTGGSDRELQQQLCLVEHETFQEDSSQGPLLPLAPEHLPSWPAYHSASTLQSAFPNLMFSARMLSSDFTPPPFIPFLNGSMGSLEHNRQQIIRTVQAIGYAVQSVFGDQIANWTNIYNRAVVRQEIMNQPETSLEQMVKAVSYHNSDNIARTHKFADLLPGMRELDLSSQKCMTVGWKWLVYYMIHHARFFADVDSYYTVGSQQFHYCRYWQEIIHEWSLLYFVYKFCAEVRMIGLNQTEQYLLMAIVMFEPGNNLSDQSLHLKIIHRHYTDALLDCIKRRCSEYRQVAMICRKLERFFSILKMVDRLHRYYLLGATAASHYYSVLAKAVSDGNRLCPGPVNKDSSQIKLAWAYRGVIVSNPNHI